MRPRDRLILTILALAFVATLHPRAARAAEAPLAVEGPARADRMPKRKVAVGAILGDPTALDLKLRFDPINAVQIRAGWAVADPYRDRVVVLADYVAHIQILSEETAQHGLLTPYVGVGGKLGIREGGPPVTVGVRVPVGLAFMLRAVPLEVFMELVPGVHVVPDVSALVDAGLGARVYF